MAALLACSVAGLGVRAVVASAEPARYEIVEIGPLPRVADDVAPAINDAGEIAAWSGDDDGWTRAFVRRAGRTVGLGPSREEVSSIARGLNARGQTVGWSVRGQNLVDSTAARRAFVWRDGRRNDLGTLGGRESQAMDINDGGTIVGVSSLPDGTRRAFLFRRRLEALGGLPGGRFSAAMAINRRGVIAGTAETAEGSIHAVMWREGRIIDLGTLPGGARSSALDLNEHGDVVGFSEAKGAETRAFVYSNGHLQDLGSLGEEPVRASAINDRGVVVGSSGVGNNRRHAFVWESGTMTDLNTLVEPGKWRLQDAHAINERGEILCTGIGETPPGWLLLLRPLKNGGVLPRRDRSVHRR